MIDARHRTQRCPQSLPDKLEGKGYQVRLSFGLHQEQTNGGSSLFSAAVALCQKVMACQMSYSSVLACEHSRSWPSVFVILPWTIIP